MLVKINFTFLVLMFNFFIVLQRLKNYRYKKMKTEFEKMRNGELYDFSDAEILKSLIHAKETCAKLQTVTITSPNYRQLIEDLIPNIPSDSKIVPPFQCDHGNGIIIGKNVFLNYNCVILDGGYVTLGDNVKIGPACQIYTPTHPFDHVLRRETKETALPVTIGEDTWLGGNVTVCPGVNIGKRCIIGAGSVVTKDIPDDSLAVGNPAKVIRKLN